MTADRWLVAGLLATLLGCQQAPPAPLADKTPREPVEARASVDRAVATTGDLLTFTVTVDRRADIEIEMPEVASEIAGFRLVDLSHEVPETRGDRVVDRYAYQLRADLVGSYVLPPVEIRWRSAGDDQADWESIATSELFVEVASVLPEGEEVSDIRELKGLRPPPEREIWPWAAGGGVLLALLLLALWIWRRRRAGHVEPPRPAHEVAFEALDTLRGTDFEDRESVRRYYFALSEIVRAYVEGRWGWNATDLTTEEIFEALETRRSIAAQHKEKLRHFLLATDRVKFAAYEPSAEEIRESYEEALSFVESTRPSEVEEANAPAESVTATDEEAA